MDESAKIIKGVSKTVVLDSCTVTVKKLGLISYTKMQTILDGIVSSATEFIKKKDEYKYAVDISYLEILENLCSSAIEILSSNAFLLVDFLELCTNLDREYIENYIGIDDAIELLEAIIEVNKLVQVAEKVKKLIATLTRSM